MIAPVLSGDPARQFLVLCGVGCLVLGVASIARNGWRAQERQQTLLVAGVILIVMAIAMPPLGR